MQGFDTNSVVRLLVRDDETQLERAEKIFRQAVSAGGAWIRKELTRLGYGG